jgi:tetratricopeptide (TPR) repeat protein
MSIIYEALKKAEREREPLPRGLAVRRVVRLTHQRWAGIAVASLLIGVTLAGGISAWVWLWPKAALPGSMELRSTASVASQERLASQDGEPVSFTTAPTQVARASLPSRVDTVVSASAAAVTPGPANAPTAEPDRPTTAARPASQRAAPTTAEAAFEKAVQAESDGRGGEAVQYYQQAIALKPSMSEAHNNLGRLYTRQHQLGAAIEEFRAALAVKPDYAIARNNLGSAYLMTGQEPLAVQEFLAAVRLDHGYATPYYNLASVSARRGDVSQAMAFLRRAMTLEPAVLSWAWEDPDFASIRAMPEFQRLRLQSHAKR